MKKIAQAMCAIVLALLTFMIVPMNSALAGITCHDIDGQSITPKITPTISQCSYDVEADLNGPVCLNYDSQERYQQTVTETWNHNDDLPQQHKLEGNVETNTRVYRTSSPASQNDIIYTVFWQSRNWGKTNPVSLN